MKKSKKTSNSISYGQFMLGAAHQEAIKQTIKLLEEEEEKQSLMLLESSDRAKEGNREDAEVDAREETPVTLSQPEEKKVEKKAKLRKQKNTDPTKYGAYAQSSKKLEMSDETYERLFPFQLATAQDNKKWYLKIAHSGPIGKIVNNFANSNRLKFNDFFGIKHNIAKKWADLFYDIIDNQLPEWERNRELRQYSDEAIEAAKKRYGQKLLKASLKAMDQEQGRGVPIIKTPLDGLDDNVKQQIIDRENQYSKLIGATDAISEQQQQPLSAPDYQIPQQPTNYGINYWRKDWWSNAMQDMNRVQADKFVGSRFRFMELDDMAEQAKAYYKAKGDINSIPQQLQVLRRFLAGEATPWDRQVIASLAGKSSIDEVSPDDLLKLKNSLDENLNNAYGNLLRYKTAAERIESFDPAIKNSSFFNPIRFVEDLHTKIYTKLNKTIDESTKGLYDPSYTPPLADQVKALEQNLSGLRDASLDKKIQILENFQQEGYKKLPEWQTGIEVNEEDIDRWLKWHDVSPYFKYKVLTSDGSWWKPETYMYKQSNLWGSSQSSWIKQSIAFGLNTIGAFLPGGQLGALGRGALGGTSFLQNMSASGDENEAEVAENAGIRIKNNIVNAGLEKQFMGSRFNNIDDAIEAYKRNPWPLQSSDLRKAVFGALNGVNSLYEDDMAAVIGDNIMDTYLQITPFASYARAVKPSSFAKASRFASKVSTISPSLYAPSMAASKVVQSLLNTAAAKAIAKATNKTIGFAQQIPERLLGKRKYKEYLKKLKAANKNVFGSNSIPHRVLSAEAYTKYQAIKDYGKNVAGTMLESAISEGIEEGKQYLHGQRFISGEYDDDLHKQLLNTDRIVNDITAGLQSAVAMASLLPLVPAFVKDEDLIENIKGGMLGGMFQTGMLRTTFGVVDPIQQIKAQNFIANEYSLEKQAEIDDFQKASMYAKKARSGPNTQARVLMAFDRYADAIQNRIDAGDKEYTAEDVELIKQQKKIAQSVFSLATDPKTARIAKQLGIADPSENEEEFDGYIGAVSMMLRKRDVSKQNFDEAQKAFTEEVNKYLPEYTLDETTGSVSSTSTLSDGIKMQREVKIAGPDGKPLRGEALLQAAKLNFADNLRAYSRIASLRSILDYIDSTLADEDISSLTRKDLEFERKWIKRNLRAELMRFEEDRRDYIEQNAASYLNNVGNSEELLQAAHREIMAKMDYDHDDAIVSGMLGSYIDLSDNTDEQLEDYAHSGLFNARAMVRSLLGVQSADKQLADRIEQDWINQQGAADDRYLDKIEEQRRTIKEQDLKRRLAKIEEDEDDIYEEQLLLNAGQFEGDLFSEEETEEEGEAPIDESQFEEPVAPEQPMPRKQYVTPKTKEVPIEREGMQVRGKLPYYGNEPKTTITKQNEAVMERLPEVEQAQLMIDNVPEINIIDIRPETAWKAQQLSDRLAEWKQQALAGKASAGEFDLIMSEINQLQADIQEEVYYQGRSRAKRDILLKDRNTLRRYDPTEDYNTRYEDTLEQQLSKDIVNTFRNRINSLLNTINEIREGQHMQDGQIDSPTTTALDENVASIDELIDAAERYQIQLDPQLLERYAQAKQYLASTQLIDGSQSQPTIVTTPTTPVHVDNGEVRPYIKSSIYGHGIDTSVAEDGTKLSDVINNPDFITNGVFELVVTEHKQKASTQKKISIVVHYGGKVFSPVTLDSLVMKRTDAGKGFWQDVQGVYNLHKLEDGQMLVPVSVYRTAGVPIFTGKYGNALEGGLISVDRRDGVLNLYDVEYGEGQTSFGISRTRPTTNGKVTQVIARNSVENKASLPLYIFDTPKNAGSLYMIINRPFSEFLKGQQPKIPVLLKPRMLTKGDAQLIVDIFRGKCNPQGISGAAALQQPVYIGTTNSGVSGYNIISMLIQHSSLHDSMYSRAHYSMDPTGMVLKVYADAQDGKIHGTAPREFDLSTETGANAFIEYAQSSIEVAVSEHMLQHRFGYNQHTAEFPLHNLFLQQGIVQRLNAGESIRFGESSIVVDQSDIVNPNDASDNRGLSYLGWMLKNGLLETDFGGVQNTNLVVDTNAGIRVADSKIDQQAQVSEVPDVALKFDIDEEAFFPKATKELPKRSRLTEQEARKNLHRIFGRWADTHVEVKDAVLDLLKDGTFLLGLCKFDSIQLSTFAEAGTEYHESFHRIVEILLPQSIRNAVYKAYKSNKKDAAGKTDAEIAELLADEFMYYATNRPTFKLPHSIKEAFLMVSEFVDFFKHIGSFRLYLMYSLTNSGILGRLLTINEDRAKTFEKRKAEFLSKYNGQLINDGLPKIVRGADLPHVINSAMYRDLRNAFAYLLFETQTIDSLGRNIQDLKTSAEHIRATEMYKEWMLGKCKVGMDVSKNPIYQDLPQNTVLALQEMLDNWDKCGADVVSYISQFATDYKAKIEQENDEDKDGDEDSIAGAAIGDHTRASYEFSQFSRASSRVKFFFSAIPDRKWKVEDGRRIPVFQLNKAGLPLLADSKWLFNTILNRLHSCQTYEEILKGLKNLGMGDARIYHAYKRLQRIYNSVQNGTATAEQQAILTQIKGLIRCAKNEFIFAKSSTGATAFRINLQPTDAEYNAQLYVSDWQDLFVSGVGAYVKVGTDGRLTTKGSYKSSVFARVAERIEQMVNQSLDPTTNPEQLKKQIVGMLQSMAIQFDYDMLQHMLENKYGSSDIVGVSKFLNDPDFGIMGFANTLRTLFNSRDELVDSNLRKFMLNSGFVHELANWKYDYRHAHDQLTVLAAENNKYYVMSENNYITDQTDHLNRRDETFNLLCGFSYNLFSPENDGTYVGSSRDIGSVVLKFLKHMKSGGLTISTFAGFKTDQPGDTGQDYAKITPKEDYISKATMLLKGRLVFPTMSDKKTWVFIDGVPMPGLKFSYINKQIVCNAGSFNMSNITDEMVEQFWEYAMCERKAIQETLDDLKTMPDNQKVANYHTSTVKIGDKEYKIAQGARFSSLLGVWNDGKFIEFNRVLDENGKFLSEEDNLAIADQYFFDLPVAQQKDIIRDLLNRKVREELQTVEQYGLIGVDGNGMYYNKGLDEDMLNAIVQAILNSVSPSDGQALLLSQLSDEDQRSVVSRAIQILVGDIACKHAVSLQEVERLYSGHPAAFSWKYDSNGHLESRSIDQHKRFGGLVSTGVNNDTELKGIPEEYTCAEIDNPMVQTEHADRVEQLMYEGELRSALIRTLHEQAGLSFLDYLATSSITLEVDAMTIEEVEQKLGDAVTAVIKAKALKKSNVLRLDKSKKLKGIDVADGGAYITDEMAEWLLREVGSWNDDVEKAFKVLRGEKVNGRVYTTKDIRELVSAYDIVYTTVIGSQKYTSFGMRRSGSALIPYYNKMALFPMFKCMCTGGMADVYKLMKDQGVHMLMINSAVKVGSQGSLLMDLNNLEGFRFNTYRQRFDNLRKQFNTDPKEAEEMKVGTQAQKVAMEGMIAGRQYTFRGGQQSAQQMLSAIMLDQREISNLGQDELYEEFFDVERDDKGNITKKTLNQEKLSLILTEELMSRGASSEMLDAVSIVKDDSGSHLKMPLCAISSMNWIQSILVSRVNKRTTDVRIPGAAFIQRSVFGMEGTSVLTQDDVPPSINGGKRLQMINEEGSMDCVLSIDFFDHLIPKVPKRDSEGNIIYRTNDDGTFVLDKQGNRVPVMTRMPFEQARKWLIDQGIIGGAANIFGYRIPTQAVSSIHALRCVDVLPVVRDTVILPAEFTAITGSDFKHIEVIKSL